MNPFSEFLQKIMAYGLELYGVFYGAYRGVVVNNVDPEQYGRVQVHVPQIHGDDYPDVWAWPKLAWATNKGGFIAIPDIGDTVWVSFDHGRADCPIWEGNWFGTGELPSLAGPKQVLLITPEGLRIHLDRTAITATIALGMDKTVTVSADTIKLSHPTKVELETPLVHVSGSLEVGQNLTVTQEATISQDATIGGKSFLTHKHPVGNPNTAPPL